MFSTGAVKPIAAMVFGVSVGLGSSGLIHAQQPPDAPAAANEIAFVNVHTVTMSDPFVRRDQVVIVRSGRIVAVGSRRQIPVSPEALVVDGAGRYLVPGLTDAHVHLDGDGTRTGTSRPDFGDGPLYLAYGVTTVVNLRGLPEHLEWRRRVAAGEIAGPTIYTAGEFVNEPRVHTPEDVQRELEAQARAGYDLIKFREVYTRERGFLTTEGLPLETYLRMNDVARELGLPLTGHAPVNLGLDAVIQARQSLAHLGALSNVHFLPLLSNPGWLLTTAAAFAALTVIAIWTGLTAFVSRRHVLPKASPAAHRVRVLAGVQLLAAAAAAASAILFLPGGLLFGSEVLRLVFTCMILLVTVVIVLFLFATRALWREPHGSSVVRVQAVVASIASIVLAWAALAFWVPMVWRSSERGIDRLASELRDTGIFVTTTLVAYDAIGGPGRQALVDDPAIAYLRQDVQARWRRLRAAAPRLRYADFMKNVAGALHREGIPLIAGTDAMGYPLVTPGSSLHHELARLVESGLSPYEAMRAATVVPAEFLGRQAEFGRLAANMRADLLLVDGNPLEEIGRLREPAGVMARGRWMTRAQLQQMLAALDR